MLSSRHLTVCRLKILKTFIINTRTSKHALKTTHTQLVSNERSNNPVRRTLILSLAAPSHAKVENASVGSGIILMETEEFAQQPHYGMWRSMHHTRQFQRQPPMPVDSYLSCQIASTNTALSHKFNTKKLIWTIGIFAL